MLFLDLVREVEKHKDIYTLFKFLWIVKIKKTITIFYSFFLFYLLELEKERISYSIKK